MDTAPLLTLIPLLIAVITINLHDGNTWAITVEQKIVTVPLMPLSDEATVLLFPCHVSKSMSYSLMEVK